MGPAAILIQNQVPRFPDGGSRAARWKKNKRQKNGNSTHPPEVSGRVRNTVLPMTVGHGNGHGRRTRERAVSRVSAVFPRRTSRDGQQEHRRNRCHYNGPLHPPGTAPPNCFHKFQYIFRKPHVNVRNVRMPADGVAYNRSTMASPISAVDTAGFPAGAMSRVKMPSSSVFSTAA